MPRRKGSRDKFPRKRKNMARLTSPESGPDAARIQAQACDCASSITQCQRALESLSQSCRQCQTVAAQGSPGAYIE